MNNTKKTLLTETVLLQDTLVVSLPDTLIKHSLNPMALGMACKCYTCYAHCEFGLLIVFSHGWLHKYLVTSKPVTITIYLTC